jgi:hypothetical protein
VHLCSFPFWGFRNDEVWTAYDCSAVMKHFPAFFFAGFDTPISFLYDRCTAQNYWRFACVECYSCQTTRPPRTWTHTYPRSWPYVILIRIRVYHGWPAWPVTWQTSMFMCRSCLFSSCHRLHCCTLKHQQLKNPLMSGECRSHLRRSHGCRLSQHSDWSTGSTTGVRFPTAARITSLRHPVQTGSGVHPDSY